MADAFVWIAVLLLVAGLVFSIAPVLPGALLSIGGLIVYWLGHGTGELGTIWLVVLLGFGVFALVFDVIASIASARYGGASTKTAVVGLVVGVVAMLLWGPLGLIVGTALSIFVIELVLRKPVTEAGRAAIYTTIGILASKVVQVLITALMLIAFLWLVFV